MFIPSIMICVLTYINYLYVYFNSCISNKNIVVCERAMAENESGGGQVSTPFLSPDSLIQHKDVGLMFNCIDLNAMSYAEEERHQFIRKTRDLMVQLKRYTTPSQQEELIKWYDQMNAEIEVIKKQKHLSDKERRTLTLEKMYEYSLMVHEHNQNILLSSPIVEIEVEGILDITDEDAITVIRGGKRTDDGRIIAK